MSKNILFFVQRMKQGFGVAVVVDHLSRELKHLGCEVGVVCFESDIVDPPYSIHLIPSTISLGEIRELGRRLGNPILIAHTAPFIEWVSELSDEFECWAYEHGEPTPTFFPDAVAREAVKVNKQLNCYSKLKGIIVISEFIKKDIGFPGGKVIYNGCDHAPNRGKKQKVETDFTNRPLRVGTLMRLGEGEAFYKGNQIFTDIAASFSAKSSNADAQKDFEFFVMGSGTLADAQLFQKKGIEVHLNGSDSEKWDYLRNLDVFISCSQWEGCNLPLIEAEAMGTLGIAFAIGAHPEMTPFLVSTTAEAILLLQKLRKAPEELQIGSDRSYDFVRSRFAWKETAAKLLAFLN